MLGLVRSLFSFAGRINRIQFLVRFACLCAVTVAFVVNDEAPPETAPILEVCLRACLDVVVFCLLAWCFWANSAKRWHDSDHSGFHALINIVPLIGFPLNFLLNVIMPGTPDSNRFGAPPSWK
jgi:uncharacterized membrane protein YhaH (DUF805 family)